MNHNHFCGKSLPALSKEAQQHSLLLQNFIQQKIQTDGPISFSDFMEMALYTPKLGYYTSSSTKFGRQGDFTTAPELSPFFGASIAESFLQINTEMTQQAWLELGAGTGKLAASILDYLDQQNALPTQYLICEISEELRTHQKVFLQSHLSTECFSRVAWVNACPENFIGIILANEVLDALPVDRFVITEDGPKLMYLALRHHKEHCSEASQDFKALDYHVVLRAPCNDIQHRLQILQETFHFPQGYTSEINLRQEAFVKFLSRQLKQGLMMFIDYGYPARVYYHPDRMMGTFRCHYQQHAHDDPFHAIGLQDMTAHVNFTALGRTGIESGLQLLYYAHQVDYLLDARIIELAQNACANLDETLRLQHQQALQTLLSPNGMGEQFKVMLFEKNLSLSEPIYSRSDRKFDL